MTTESTPVTIHTHTRGTTTFVSGTPNEIQTLASDQAGHAVLGMAVLADWHVWLCCPRRSFPIISTTTTTTALPVTRAFRLRPSTMALRRPTRCPWGSPDDTSGGVNPNLAGRGTSAETGTQPASDFLDLVNFAEDMQIVALSGGGYVIDETTLVDADWAS